MFANKSHAQAFEMFLKMEFAAALDLFNEAVTETPNHPDLLSDRAFCLWRLGRRDDCIQDLEDAAKLQPLYAYRHSCLGFVLQLTGNSKAAKTKYERALSIDPTESIALHNLACIDKPTVVALLNPEDIRKRILKTYIEFTKQFPNPEDQRKLIQFLKNRAK